MEIDEDWIYLITLESEDESDDEDNLLQSESIYEYIDDEHGFKIINTVTTNVDQTPSTSQETDPIFNWKRSEFVPKIHPFDNSESGSKLYCLDVDMNESDYFKLFFNNDLMSTIVKETNKQYKFATKNLTTLSERTKRWTDTTVDELYVFFAICMLMARNSRNSIEEYWHTDPLLYSEIYGSSMGRNRFQLLFRMLHFCDNEHQIPGDRLYKIRNIVDHAKLIFSSLFCPYQNLCINESFFLHKGKQYISTKNSRQGMKIYILCDCMTGYVLNLKICTGIATENSIGENLDVSKSIVMSLLSPYLGYGHSLYTNDFCTSPLLFQALHKTKTNACGVVRKNRKYMPKDIPTIEKGEMVTVHANNVAVQTWKDEQNVTMLTTIHKNSFSKIIKKNRMKKNADKKPSSVADYCKNMKSADKSGIGLSGLVSLQKTITWYKKLFFHIMDLCLLNAHIIYLKTTGKKVSVANFQLEVIRQLLETHKMVIRKKRAVVSDSRLQIEQHFMEKTSPAKHRCIVCAKKKQRKETVYMCKQCQVPLCVVPCFGIYHTEKNY